MLIALGVTGGIGAYKAVEVARGLQKRGHDVVAIMTASARQFVGEVTFEAITRRPVITDQYARGANANIEHIALATDIGLLLVAPATANTIGKLANGIADGFLACGWIGKGRLAEPDAIVDAAEQLLKPAGSLLGRRIVVSAGPTYEDIDAVRYIGNRSSGRLGYAIATEASRR